MVAAETKARHDWRMTTSLRAVARPARLLAFTASLALANSASAQPAGQSMPMAAPLPPALPDAVDAPYPGTIGLAIDASDVNRAVYRVNETIPVEPGVRQITLLLPKWLPGNHGPTGAISLLSDLHFAVNGKPVTWTRDAVDAFAFHLDLPDGARTVEARFVHTSPLLPAEGRVTMTREMLNLQWEKMSLYPAGHYVRQIKVAPTVTFPAGWTPFTALDGQKADGARVAWSPVDYATLVDSPVFAGINARRWDLGHAIQLSVVADKPEQLALAPANLDSFKKLADEAVSLFGSRHFDHYDSLLALTDRMGGIGLEHHRSSENSYEPKSFTEWAALDWAHNVVSHELVHSWNGKFRRPAGLWTPDYRQPMQTDLLWVYEGQTQFWGLVLAARSGVQRPETILGNLATLAALYSEGQPGRGWRPVEDTTRDPVFAMRRALPYPSLSRSEDYYNESALVWLETDQLIRERTQGAKGLDDFARAFFGAKDGDWGEVTYTFEDVAGALNAVTPYDWATFLKQRFYQAGQPAPLSGIERGGYRLVWKDTPNAFEKGRMAGNKTLGLTYSLGLTIDREGKVSATLWNGPAFNAGIVNGAKVVAVNGLAYDDDTLRAAITAAKGTKAPIALLVQRGDRFLTVDVDYHGGLRYPWLERVVKDKAPAGLDQLLSPRTTTAPVQ
jgi:predicted metalloprotease with PDZ domain